MRNILMLNKLYVPNEEGSEKPVFFECTIHNVNNLYRASVSEYSQVDVDYTKLEKFVNDNDLITGNFYFNSDGLKPLSPFFTVSDEYREMKEDTITASINATLTVAKILGELAETDSVLKFLPEYYNDVTGSESFQKFSPSFDNAVIHANKLTISSKKFNIVLTSVIPGIVDIHGLPNPVSRFFPFKIVKFGELKHDFIEVLPNSQNSVLLSRIGVMQDDGYSRVNLTRYPIFSDKSNLVTGSVLSELASSISLDKSIAKGMSYYRSKIKSSLIQVDKATDLITDWLRGDALEDSVISDAGSDTLEFWIKGNKSSISTNKLLEETGDFGLKLAEFSSKLADLDDVPKESITSPVMTMSKPISEMYERNLIKYDEMFLLGSILESMLKSGAKRARFEELSKDLKELSKKLTRSELLSLELRWSLLNQVGDLTLEQADLLKTIGTFNRGQNSNIAHISFETGSIKPVTIKKGKIEGGNDNPNYNPSSVSVYITDNIKGVDGYGTI